MVIEKTLENQWPENGAPERVNPGTGRLIEKGSTKSHNY